MPTRMKIENKEIEISFAAKLLIMISDWRVGIGWQTANCVELEVIKKRGLWVTFEQQPTEQNTCFLAQAKNSISTVTQGKKYLFENGPVVLAKSKVN